MFCLFCTLSFFFVPPSYSTVRPEKQFPFCGVFPQTLALLLSNSAFFDPKKSYFSSHACVGLFLGPGTSLSFFYAFLLSSSLFLSFVLSFHPSLLLSPYQWHNFGHQKMLTNRSCQLKNERSWYQERDISGTSRSFHDHQKFQTFSVLWQPNNQQRFCNFAQISTADWILIFYSLKKITSFLLKTFQMRNLFPSFWHENRDNQIFKVEATCGRFQCQTYARRERR